MTALCISHKALVKSCRDMFVCLAVFVGLCGVAHCGTGCQDAKDSLSDPAHNYATEIIACAATAGYPGAYDRSADMRCRNDVNCRYGLPSCIGGADAGR